MSRQVNGAGGEFLEEEGMGDRVVGFFDIYEGKVGWYGRGFASSQNFFKG